MSFYIGIFILFFSISGLSRPLKRGVINYPEGRSDSLNNSIMKSNFDTLKSQDFLREVKFNILNGNLNHAKILLKRATITTSFTKPIQYRYLALVHFIQGNYTETIKILNKQEMMQFTTQSKVCIMKVLSYIILDKEEEIKSSWRDCRDASLGHSPSNLAWMNILVNMKVNKDEKYLDRVFDKIKIENTNKDELTTILKLSLYLSRQKDLIPRFHLMSNSVLEDPVQRELMALNYYRNNDLVRSFQLLSPLTTANAEVFKGNILLARKKFELAYAQFKLALNKKSNSKNALDRLLPLAWKLSQWNEGIDFIQKLEINRRRSHGQKLEVYTLMSAFLTMAGKHNAAKMYLNKIDKINNKIVPIEVSQLKVLNALKRKNEDEIIDNANKSCIHKDGINCWLLIALSSWDSLLIEVDTPKKIHTRLKDLTEKFKSNTFSEPLGDEILVEQRYIQELDNNLIKLIK